MQLYFIRHGQSVNNLVWDQIGRSDNRVADPELTHYGRQQAQAIANFLAQSDWSKAATHEASLYNVDGFAFSHLYVSPMIRCMDTAAPIVEAMDLEPVMWIDIHEQGGSCLRNKSTRELEGLPGTNRAFFEARYPQTVLPPTLDEKGWWNKPAEDWTRCYARAGKVLKELLAKHGQREDKVALVSHGAFYNALMRNILGMPVEAKYWFTLNNTGLTRIDFHHGEETRLPYLNRVDFLPPENCYVNFMGSLRNYVSKP